MFRNYCFCAIFVILAQPVVNNRMHAAEKGESYLWLEEVTGKKALDWVQKQNDACTGELTPSPLFKSIQERALKTLNSDDRIISVTKRGDYLYNFWTDAKSKRGVWRRTTRDEYKKPNPTWETVLDVDALAEAEKENWVWGGPVFMKPSSKTCLITLSRGGADASVIREFDVATKTFVKDGFQLPEAKSVMAWVDENTVFVGTDFGPGSMTNSGYPRVLKEWKRGTPLAEAKLVFEGKPEDVSVAAGVSHMEGFHREYIVRSVNMYKAELYLRQAGKLVKIDTPDDASAGPYREMLYIQLRSPWKVNGQTYPTGAVLTANFEAFMNGERTFEVLFEPTERKSLADLVMTKNYLILNELDNVRNKLYVVTRKDGQWLREEMPGVPNFGTVSVEAINDQESDDYAMTVTDFITPTTYYLGTVGKGPAKKEKQTPAYFKADGLVVTQHQATSKDGTRIPYFQVARKDVPLNGKNPTLLCGYGGFEIPLVPSYNPIAGAAWLEKGGVYVVANIRGGGEFGPPWHQAALKGNRHRAYEDFAAVAEDLIHRKVTQPKHLGIEGGSNGGLLVGNMLTLRPELFGAVICQVPLLDMERYHKLLAGASWIAEYGNPEDPQELAALKTFSPFHNVRKEAKYPRTLFTTSTRDDRVHPGHARRMVAKMKDMGHDVMYFENIEGGHNGSADNSQYAFMSALEYTFLWNQLKPEPATKQAE